MAADGHYKIACPHCGIHIEFPHELEGAVSDCPDCGCSVAVVSNRPKPALPPLIPMAVPVAMSAKPVRYGKIKNADWIGVGCLLQGLGVLAFLAFLYFPFSTLIGLVFLIAGGVVARKRICSL